jgi:hypothetical protein
MHHHDPLGPDQELSEEYILALIGRLRDVRDSLRGDYKSSYLPLYRMVMELYRIYWHDRKRFATVTGHKSMIEMGKGELDLRRRSMFYLISIGKLLFVTLRDHPETMQKVASIGFTRLIHIVNVITPQNALAWYDFVLEHSHVEIKRAVTEYKRELKAQKRKPVNITQTFEFIP